MKNPFPGMNPWLEEFWRDVHASVLVYARDQLADELPPGLHARVDERLGIDVGEEKPPQYLPDLAITEPWDYAPGPVLGRSGAKVVADEPQVVDLSEVKLRHVEIVDSREHVITVIELISPTNKDSTEQGTHWSRKRGNCLRGGINFVEIDLLRAGGWIMPDRSLLRPIPPERVFHHVCVTRPPKVNRHEFYTMPLRQRLSIIRIPLRRTDPDVALDLQALVDQCYERGHFDTQIRYEKPPNPPLPKEEAAWAREVLLACGKLK